MSDAGESDPSEAKIRIKRTAGFVAWLDGLRDRPTRLRLIRRLDRASRGQLGDVKALGGGLYEMREHFGAGWRMYYVQRGAEVILLLGGGEKSTQAADIAKAARVAATLGGATDA